MENPDDLLRRGGEALESLGASALAEAPENVRPGCAIWLSRLRSSLGGLLSGGGAGDPDHLVARATAALLVLAATDRPRFGEIVAGMDARCGRAAPPGDLDGLDLIERLSRRLAGDDDWVLDRSRPGAAALLQALDQAAADPWQSEPSRAALLAAAIGDAAGSRPAAP